MKLHEVRMEVSELECKEVQGEGGIDCIESKACNVDTARIIKAPVKTHTGLIKVPRIIAPDGTKRDTNPMP